MDFRSRQRSRQGSKSRQDHPLAPPQDNRKGSAIALPFPCNYRESLLFGESFVYFVIGHHFFLEHIGSGLGRFHNFNHLSIGSALTFLKRCDGFLFLGSLLFNFFVNGYSSQNGVVFFQLQTLSGVFSVFGGNITRHAGQTTIFLFIRELLVLYYLLLSLPCSGPLIFKRSNNLCWLPVWGLRPNRFCWWCGDRQLKYASWSSNLVLPNRTSS